VIARRVRITDAAFDEGVYVAQRRLHLARVGRGSFGDRLTLNGLFEGSQAVLAFYGRKRFSLRDMVKDRTFVFWRER